jgi:hypothetical protein
MQSSHGSGVDAVDSPECDPFADIPPHRIFVQTTRGAQVAPTPRAALPERLRMLLCLVNGRRRMSEYRDLLPRFRGIDEAFSLLALKGYIEGTDGERPEA